MNRIWGEQSKLNAAVESLRKEINELKTNGQGSSSAATAAVSVPDYGEQIGHLRDMLEKTVPALITKYDTISEAVAKLETSLLELRSQVQNSEQFNSSVDVRLIELQNQLTSITALATEEP
jgi:chromosome segregation ATPase